jgi:1-acyl-sn-glycerol-3-phosphate acyltransferase
MARRVFTPWARPEAGALRRDAAACVGALPQRLRVLGGECRLEQGPGLIVMNHYSRPGLWAWWMVLAISAQVPADIHWVTTAALRRGWPVAALSRWVLRRAARLYGFTTMPPMPPRPGESAERARAVRQVLDYARRAEAPLVGLAPEGADQPGARLGWPPAGAGRFMYHLARAGLPVAPVGVYESDGGLVVHFGRPYALPPLEQARGDLDRVVSERVMRSIAGLLPAEQQGPFGGSEERWRE